MTGGSSRAAHHASARSQLSPRAIAWTLVRVAGSIIVLTTLYYVLPLDHASLPSVITMLVVGLAGFVTLVVFQVERIVRSPLPGARAAESLATSVPFFILLFAATYVALAGLSPSNFGEHLTHTDGLYFAVTVFATVGFGDITAKTETARLVVTGQMIADLVVLGVAVRVVVGAVRRSRQRMAPPQGMPASPGLLDREDDDPGIGPTP
ncbi:two pore domain potassium channel family protein [Streptacidiphilus pinicola]|uniref:Two pore domain potassium channel family protein n=1 Tax=Streptacidiphilus pinicola TaxID=2219663 RepID=A0A2X0JWI4_9ACTN|nr:potassium channel family protein [Streptacidiphilus pinicola]RAG81305.1 two pore domain potassium channel family protein [Streptacidiphilus pinicola]